MDKAVKWFILDILSILGCILAIYLYLDKSTLIINVLCWCLGFLTLAFIHDFGDLIEYLEKKEKKEKIDKNE